MIFLMNLEIWFVFGLGLDWSCFKVGESQGLNDGFRKRGIFKICIKQPSFSAYKEKFQALLNIS